MTCEVSFVLHNMTPKPCLALSYYIRTCIIHVVEKDLILYDISATKNKSEKAF